MLLSLVLGIRLRRTLPEDIQSQYLFLLGLMSIFFCGHLAFAALLLHNFPFPLILLSSSIFLGGLFSLVVIAISRTAANTIQSGKSRLSRTTNLLRLRNSRLSRETKQRKATEKKLDSSSALFLKDMFEIMDEILANRDQYTFEHDIQVAEIATRIGRELKMGEDDLKILELGCLIHDIGKTAIPDDVLLKPGQFDTQERDIIRYHPLIGAKLIARHIQDDRITDIILNHHERLDGSGYPAGLKGEEIGLLPRIVAVADTYEALTARRPYKKRLSPQKALITLRREAELGRVDSDAVKALEKIVPSLPPVKSSKRVTAGFMEDVELFRSRSYFREPMTGFYNYRYLLALDEAGILQNKTLPYKLSLVRAKDLDGFQHRSGYMVADQILDELGEDILGLCASLGSKREQYDGSYMMFRKGTDFLIYAEYKQKRELKAFHRGIEKLLKRAEKDWQLKCSFHAEEFARATPVSSGLAKLFAAV